MNSRERVFAALELKEPDMVPVVEFGIHPVIRNEIGKRLWGLETVSLVDLSEGLGLDGVCVNEDYHKERIDDHLELDEWGIVRDLTAGQSVGYPVRGPIKTSRDLERYTPPDPWAAHRWTGLREVVHRCKGDKAVCVWIHDAYQIPSFLLGGEAEFLLKIYDNPALVKSVIELSVEYHIALVKHALKLGAEVFISGDDYAYKSGPMMSPQHFREFILPGLKRIVKTVKEGGGFFIKHSDGNIWSLLDMFLEAGVDAINPLEPTAGMDIGAIKQKYGHKVALVGNIDCGDLLSFGSVEKVRAAVLDCLHQAAPGGGYIMSSSNSIHRGVKPENFVEMVSATRQYGRYPLQFPDL